MNIVQSICCLFSRGCGEQTTSTPRDESPGAKADLGQTEAVLEKTGRSRWATWEGTKPGIAGEPKSDTRVQFIALAL